MSKVTATAEQVALAKIYLELKVLKKMGADDGPGYTWDALPKIIEFIEATLEKRPVGNDNLGFIFHIAMKNGPPWVKEGAT